MQRDCEIFYGPKHVRSLIEYIRLFHSVASTVHISQVIIYKLAVRNAHTAVQKFLHSETTLQHVAVAHHHRKGSRTPRTETPLPEAVYLTTHIARFT